MLKRERLLSWSRHLVGLANLILVVFASLVLWLPVSNFTDNNYNDVMKMMMMASQQNEIDWNDNTMDWNENPWKLLSSSSTPTISTNQLFVSDRTVVVLTTWIQRLLSSVCLAQALLISLLIMIPTTTAWTSSRITSNNSNHHSSATVSNRLTSNIFVAAAATPSSSTAATATNALDDNTNNNYSREEQEEEDDRTAVAWLQMACVGLSLTGLSITLSSLFVMYSSTTTTTQNLMMQEMYDHHFHLLHIHNNNKNNNNNGTSKESSSNNNKDNFYNAEADSSASSSSSNYFLIMVCMGTAILLLSAMALMISFWPSSPASSTSASLLSRRRRTRITAVRRRISSSSSTRRRTERMLQSTLTTTATTPTVSSNSTASSLHQTQQNQQKQHRLQFKQKPQQQETANHSEDLELGQALPSPAAAASSSSLEPGTALAPKSQPPPPQQQQSTAQQKSSMMQSTTSKAIPPTKPTATAAAAKVVEEESNQPVLFRLPRRSHEKRLKQRNKNLWQVRYDNSQESMNDQLTEALLPGVASTASAEEEDDGDNNNKVAAALEQQPTDIDYGYEDVHEHSNVIDDDDDDERSTSSSVVSQNQQEDSSPEEPPSLESNLPSTTATTTVTTSRSQGVRRLLSLAAPEVLYLYAGCTVLLMRLPFSLSIPHFVSTTLSSVARGDYARAQFEILYLVCAGSMDAILDFWCIFLFGLANLRIVKTVRLGLFQHLLGQEIAFFDVVTSSELASRLQSDCSEMAADLTWFFRFSIESIVRITGITTYMLLRSPTLGAVALSVAPMVALINKLYGNWLHQNAARVQTALAQANAVAQEALSNVRTVIAFCGEQLELEKYEDKIEEHYQLNFQQLFMTGVYYMVVSTFLMNTIVQALLLYIGTQLIQRSDQYALTPDILLAFMLYQGQLQSETLNLFQSYTSLLKSSGAGDKVFALMDRKPPPPSIRNERVRADALYYDSSTPPPHYHDDHEGAGRNDPTHTCDTSFASSHDDGGGGNDNRQGRESPSRGGAGTTNNNGDLSIFGSDHFPPLLENDQFLQQQQQWYTEQLRPHQQLLDTNNNAQSFVKSDGMGLDGPPNRSRISSAVPSDEDIRMFRPYHIDFQNVTFSYPTRPHSTVVNQLNLSIPHGQTVALVGRSGAGKSTIVHLLQRFYDPDSGSILIDGIDLRQMDIIRHRRQIGIVTQDPVLFVGTLLDNLRYGHVDATVDEVKEAARLAHAEEFIEQFPDGYETQVGERGAQLSGGQKQRIALARAILHTKSLLLLDEATSALDHESEEKVQKALDELLHRHERTTIVVAHRLKTVRNADRIVVMDKGFVVEQGSHDELMQLGEEGVYRSMVERSGHSGVIPDDF